jgi:tetratricopeptide (TPR) repeat protein
MPNPAVGRNDPCRCGSGKKYKKCCLARDQAQGPKIVEPPEPPVPAPDAPHDHPRTGVLHVPAKLSGAEAREYVERLDRWSNAARDALDEGRLEEAERLADRLRTEYPDQIDGYELRAMVRLQQQRWDEAAAGFEEAVAVALKNREDYDEEFIEALRRDAEHARAHARGHGWNPASPPCDSHAHGHGS